MAFNNMGESSRSHNDDGESVRPLKKAKYVWQLKGKYHLKKVSKREDAPITMTRKCDEYLKEWQTRQMTMCFFDNTINSIMEEMAPRIDVTDILENCENGSQIEHDSIMMAIQSHGLRCASPPPPPPPPLPPTPRANFSVFHATNNESALDNYENMQTERRRRHHHIELDEQIDFLNAAVSVAIEKKGLASYDYS